jgi:beta-phosphoglucomutase-like phosphatase (HAD superfamily)
VASGSEPERIRISLRTTGLESYFLNITSSYEVTKGKPEPDVFLKAAERNGFEPRHCIVIEDTIFGVTAGIAAGMKVLCYQPVKELSYAVPQGVTVFESMTQLPGLVATIAESSIS